MNREIKFRAWNGYHMLYPGDGYTDTMVLSFNKGTGKFESIALGAGDYDWEVHGAYSIDVEGEQKFMQYTGLKDKNGKEIYEGDILEYADQPSMPERFYEVVYSTSDEHISSEEPYIAAYMLKDKRGFRQLICNVTRPYRYAEVAGNIHENPELI